MNKEQMKAEIISIVKDAIFATSLVNDGYADRDNDVDNAAEDIADTLIEKGYRKTFTSDIASNTQKAFKDGYIKGSIDQMNIAIVNGGTPINKDFAVAINRLADLEDKIENGELVSKDWHDEQVLHAEDEIKRLEKVIKDKDDICYDCTKSVKEFAAKLIKPLFNGRDSVDYKQALISVCDIDEALKEYEK